MRSTQEQQSQRVQSVTAGKKRPVLYNNMTAWTLIRLTGGAAC